ncbi:MAG TPA: hypothetical protein VMO00_14970, partial [Methylomirabilota bacterium]|nr:hypothetical protein [Methylomirabilota bacterium]
GLALASEKEVGGGGTAFGKGGRFVASLLCTLATAQQFANPMLEGIRLILENFGKEYPDAPRRDPKEFVDSSFIDRLKQERFVEGLKQ